MKSKKCKNAQNTKRVKFAVVLSLIILTMSFLTGCGSDEMNDYSNDTANTMHNAANYVDKARDVADDADSVEEQTLDLDEN